MNINKIRKLATDYRKAVDIAFENNAFNKYPFNRFPRECCDDMCDLFGQLLFEKEIKVYKVRGKYRNDYDWNHLFPHSWLELENGVIIDLTGDQYKKEAIMLNYNNPCYIGEYDELHNLFLNEELQYEAYYGIDNYENECLKKRLWGLYNTIMLFYNK